MGAGVQEETVGMTRVPLKGVAIPNVRICFVFHLRRVVFGSKATRQGCDQEKRGDHTRLYPPPHRAA